MEREIFINLNTKSISRKNDTNYQFCANFSKFRAPLWKICKNGIKLEKLTCCSTHYSMELSITKKLNLVHQSITNFANKDLLNVSEAIKRVRPLMTFLKSLQGEATNWVRLLIHVRHLIQSVRYFIFQDAKVDTGWPTWKLSKVNDCCDYVFWVRHFSLQIYAGYMCTFWFLE